MKTVNALSKSLARGIRAHSDINFRTINWIIPLAVAILFLQGSLMGEVAGFSDISFPQNPFATNPAYIGLENGVEFSLEARKKLNLYDFDIGNLSLGWDNTAGNWRLGTGGNFSNTFLFGIRYTYTRNWRYENYTLGVLLRPARNLVSFGLTATPKTDSYGIGIALRPKSQLLTVFADLYTNNFKLAGSTPYKLGAQIEPIRGIKIFASYDSKKTTYIGLAAQFSHIRFSSSTDNSDYVHILQVSSKPFRSTIRGPKKFLKLNLTLPLVENPTSPFGSGKSLYDLISAIDRAKDSPEVKGIFVDMSGFGASFAQAEELRNAFLRFKEKGKRIIVYAEELGNVGYYVASVADKIIMPPSGSLTIYGLRMEVMFLKGLLDKAGVKAEFISVGKYKSAGEMFTREGMSDAAREENSAIIDELYNELISGIAQGRGLATDSVRVLVDYGIFNPVEARTAGLIDSILFLEEAQKLPGKHLKDIYKFASIRTFDEGWGNPPKIALIYATGTITSTNGSLPILGGTNVVQSSFVKMLERVEKDKDVKAAVLRVDSPGGSAIASDIILNSLSRLAKKKPLVVSMGTYAASGGYLISCTGGRIFADKSTITGSIGVISGKFALKGLYDKLGITIDTLQRGKSAGIFTTYDTLTPELKSKLEKDATYFYKIFLERVSKARSIDQDSVSSIAEGRVYTGFSAKNIGLVDSLCGLSETVEYIRTSERIPEDFEVISYPSRRDLFSFLFERVQGIMRFIHEPEKKLEGTLPFRNGEPLFIMPYIIEVK